MKHRNLAVAVPVTLLFAAVAAAGCAMGPSAAMVAGGWESALLHKIVTGIIAVERSAQKPLRPGPLEPIEAR